MTHARPTAVVRSTPLLATRRACFVATLVLGAIAPRAARAQTPAAAATAPADEEARARARTIAGQGDAAFAAGRCDRAIPLWRSANQAFAAPTIELRIAHCQALIGHVVEAAATLEAITKAPLAADAPEPWVTAKQQAVSELPTLRARIATLVIQRKATSAGAISEVVLDDAVVPPTATTFPVDPGKHRVRIRSGSDTWEQPVALDDGETRTLVATTTMEQPPPAEHPSRALPLAVLGAGLVVTAVGAVVGVKALSDGKSLDDLCGGDRKACPPDANGRITTLKTESLVTDLLIGGGVVVLGVGGFLFWRTTQVAHPPPRVKLTVTGKGGALTVRF